MSGVVDSGGRVLRCQADAWQLQRFGGWFSWFKALNSDVAFGVELLAVEDELRLSIREGHLQGVGEVIERPGYDILRSALAVSVKLQGDAVHGDGPHSPSLSFCHWLGSRLDSFLTIGPA